MKQTNLLAALVAVSLFGNMTFAQESDAPVVQESSSVEMTVIGSDDGAAPMVFSTVNGDSLGFSVASPMLIGNNSSFAMPAPDPWSMVNNPSVQKDLNLVGEQLDKVKELQREHSEEMRKHFAGMKNGSLDLGNLDGLKESMAELKRKQREQLEKLLLPHQIDRLHQVALQQHMKQAGTANALANKKVAEELGISDEQIDNLKKKAKELKEKLAKDIEALKEKMKKELLQELKPEQREKLESMVGDKYAPSKEDWKERFSPRLRERLKSRGN